MLSILSILWSGLVQIFGFWMEHLLFINIVLSILIVFFERREPRTVWTWLLLLYFIPILGVFLYFMIGHDFHKQHMFRTKEIEDAIYSAISRQEETIIRDEFEPKDPRLKKYMDVVLMNLGTLSMRRCKKPKSIFIFSTILSAATNCGSPLSSFWQKRCARVWRSACFMTAWEAEV